MDRRIAWAGVAVAALALIVLAAMFATAHALMLVLLVAWHATLIAMPMAAAIFAGLRAGIRDITVLSLYGLACGGVAAFVLFWIWRVSAPAGSLASIAFIAASAAAIAWFASRLERETIRQVRP